MATIGFFGTHFVGAVLYTVESTLRNDLYITGLKQNGEKKYLISKSMIEDVWKRICIRLRSFISTYAGFQLTSKYAAHFWKVFLEGKGTFTAGRMELLMIALPFVLRDLIRPELTLIERAIASGDIIRDAGNRVPVPADPCPGMIKALALFLDWYYLARQSLFPMAQVPELQRKYRAMKQAVKLVFPSKSGQQHGWKFPKMHSPTHKGSEILSHGSTPYTDTQIFEAGHKPNVKSLSGISNGKDQFRIVAQFHARSSTLAQLKDATNRHTQRLLRDRSVEDSESSSSDADYAHDENDDLLTDEHTSRPCEMAAKLPLLEMSYDLRAIHREPFSLGPEGRGLQRLVLAACNPQVAASVRGRDNAAAAAKYIKYAQQFPSLKFLPIQLGHFAYEYLGRRLGLDVLPEKERDIDGVLNTYLVRDSDKCDIFTFGGIALRSDAFQGTVRVRARPLDTFHGTNPQVKACKRLVCFPCLSELCFAQDAVLAIPGRPEWPRSAESFDGTNESHREQMWVCRVALFFRCSFLKPGSNAPIVCELALVNRLRKFTVPEARKHPDCLAHICQRADT